MNGDPCKGHGCDHCKICQKGYCCGKDRQPQPSRVIPEKARP